MGYKRGDSVEVTGVVFGTVTDITGTILYQICFNKDIIVAVPEKYIRLKGMERANYIEAKEYKPGRFR